MSEKKPDPKKVPEFEKVVQTFLKSPPRQHKEDVGKGRKLKPKPIKRKSE